MRYDVHRSYIWLPVLACILSVIMLLQPSASASEKTWQHIQNTKVLRLGIEPIYPPFRYYNSDDRPSGFDVEVAQKTVMYMGFHIEWVPLQKDEFYQALQDGIIDGYIASANQDRSERDLFYSEPFLENCGVFVGRKSDTSIHGLSYLKGKRIGQFVDKDEEHFNQKVADSIQVPIPDFETGIALLREGKIDGFFHDKYSTLSHVAKEKESDLKIIQLNKDSLAHVFVVQKHEEQLLKELNAALKKIQTNGIYQRIHNKYFQKGLENVSQ